MTAKTKKVFGWTKAILYWAGAFYVALYMILTALVNLGILHDGPIPAQTQAHNKSAEVQVVKPLDIAQVYKLLNDERVKAGLNPLAISTRLEQSACAKLNDMIAKDYWAHIAPDGTEPWHFFRQVGYLYVRSGENLAYGQQTESRLVENWMESPPHKKNIMGNFTEFGLCSRVGQQYQGGINNVTVNHFATPE